MNWCQVAGLSVPTMLVYADADSISPAHAAEFFGLLGGGLHDAAWEGTDRTAHRLAVPPGTTHHDVCASPVLAEVEHAFLSADDR